LISLDAHSKNKFLYYPSDILFSSKCHDTKQILNEGCISLFQNSSSFQER